MWTDAEREELRQELSVLARMLHSKDTDVSSRASSRIKDMVLASNPAQVLFECACAEGDLECAVTKSPTLTTGEVVRSRAHNGRAHYVQRPNQDLIASVDGLVEGLVNNVRRGSPHGKYCSCYALAQLAWSNQRNSVLIPSTPGALDSIALVLSDTSKENLSAREYAAISIGNCGANSEEGAETIVKHQGLMNTLILCLADTREIRIQETTVVAIKNCAASSQEAAFIIAQNDTTLLLLKDLALQYTLTRLRDVVIFQNANTTSESLTAVGAINSISRSPRAVPRLKKAGFQTEVLFNLLWGNDQSSSADLRKLTVACAMFNMEASDSQKPALLQHHGGLQQWLTSKDGKRAITNMVKCLGHALRGEQWCNVSFSPHSVVCPLYNLTRCFPTWLVSSSLDIRKVVAYISQLLTECQRFSHWKDNMHVAIKILENLAWSPSVQRLLRENSIPLLQDIASATSPRSVWFPPHPSPEDQVEMRRVMTQAEKLVKTLLMQPVAVCMGQHARLGQSSQLMKLDDAVLQMIVVYALYE